MAAEKAPRFIAVSSNHLASRATLAAARERVLEMVAEHVSDVGTADEEIEGEGELEAGEFARAGGRLAVEGPDAAGRFYAINEGDGRSDGTGWGIIEVVTIPRERDFEVTFYFLNEPSVAALPVGTEFKRARKFYREACRGV